MKSSEFYRAVDGDILQLCPIMFRGDVVNYVKFYGIYIDGTYTISASSKVGAFPDDLIFKKFLEKVRFKSDYLGKNINKYIKYILGVIIDNEPRMMVVGKTIFDLVENIDDISKVKLNVKVDKVIGSGGIYPDYKKSSIDINNIIKYDNFLIVDSYFDGVDIISNRNGISEYLGVDLVGEVISEIRDEKLDYLLNI